MNQRQIPDDGDRQFDVVVVGAGVIGLSVAFELRRRGAGVAVVEAAAAAATGATGVAAGMLAPVGELDFGEPALLEINLRSAALYPDFVSAVEELTGLDTGYRRLGGLHVALDRDEAAELKRVLDLQLSLGLDSKWLGPGASRDLEPGLHPGLNGSVLAEGDGVVDPRALSSALLAALEKLGVPVMFSAPVLSLELEDAGSGQGDGSRVSGVHLSDGRTISAPIVIAAGGAESGRSEWLPEADRPPVRPVKGQVAELLGDPADPVCSRILATERVYLVPRTDGRLIIGATVEEMGYDTAVTAGGVHELLREAYRLLPDISEMEFIGVTAGLRPGTPDNLPVVGPASTPGLILATGHYRNGILLAPVTGAAVADLVESGAAPGESATGPMSAATPARFSGDVAGTPPDHEGDKGDRVEST
ncbi:MAG: glycine oxidase ThiO [Solirubrobacterales bacterium]